MSSEIQELTGNIRTQLTGKLDYSRENNLHPQTIQSNQNLIVRFNRLMLLVERHLSQIELEQAQVIEKYNRIHDDTQKLVYLAEAHGIDPNTVFSYPLEFFKDLADHKKRVNANLLRHRIPELYFAWSADRLLGQLNPVEYLQFIKTIDANG